MSFEAHDVANRHAIDLARVEAGSVAKVSSFLGKLESELVTILADNKDLSAKSKQKLETIQQSAAAAIGKTYGKIAENYNPDLEGVAKSGAKVATNMVNAIVGVDVAGSVLTEKQLTAVVKDTAIFGHSSGAWWAGQEQGLKDKFAAQVQMGYALGEDIDTITRRIRGTKVNNFNDGIMAVSKREGEALVRSSIQTISNTARLESFKAMGDVVKGIEWVSTLDTRTTPICKALDGLRWTLEYEPVGHGKAFPGPTAHWNCRSTQVPVLYSWDELAGKKLKTLDSQTMEERIAAKLKQKGWDEGKIAKAKTNARASMDGQVPAEPMDAWLKTKPGDFVKKQLGPTKAKLWEEGKITLHDLTDQSNRPLTVDQLLAAIDAGTVPDETEGVAFPIFDKTLVPKFEADSLKAKDQAAQKKIDTVVANPKEKGNSILATMIGKVQKDEPSLTATEILAKAESLTAEKIAANTKSSVLSKAKKNILAGNPPTAAQQSLIDSLSPEEKAAWEEAVGDAVKVKKADETAAKKEKLTAIIDHNLTKSGGATNPELFDSLNTEGLDDVTIAELKDHFNAGIATAQANEKIQAWNLDPYKAKILDKATAAGNWSDPVSLAKAMEDEMKSQVLADITGDTQAAAKKAVQAITGMNGPTAKGLSTWMDQNGVSAEELKAKFDGVKAEKLQQSVQSSVLSKAKKKVAAGESPTPAQQKVLDGLTPEELANFNEDVDNLKAKLAADPAVIAQVQKASEETAAAAQRAANAASAAEAQEEAAAASRAARTTTPVVPHPDELTFVKGLGGSTGAKQYRDKDGNFYVVKRGAAPDHVRTEQLADDLYRALGMNVPEGNLFETKDGPVKVTKFLEGGKTLAQLTGAERTRAIKELQKGFQADALLANWDVAGTGLDNVMVTPDGKVWRIDNGGSLKYRAQGSTQGKNWDAYPSEFWTMRDSSNISGPIYGDMKFSTILDQIEKAPFDRLLDVPMDAATREILAGRISETRRFAARGRDFLHDGYNDGHTDGVARATIDLRKTGVSQTLPKKLQNGSAPYQMVDEAGNAFGSLRTKKAATTHTPIVQKLEGDIYGDNILTATKALASCANGGKPVTQGSAPGKIAEVLKHKSNLTTIAAHGTDEQKAMATKYLAQVAELEKIYNAGGVPKAPPPMFTVYEPPKPAAPAAVAAPKNNESVVKQWEAQMKAEGINVKPIYDWLRSQSGNSWNTETQALKVAFAKGMEDPETAYYWGGNNIKTSWTKAQTHYKAAVTAAGGEAKLQRLVTSWQALTQEILSEIDAPWIDRDRRAVLLYRTVTKDELDGSTKTPDDKGHFVPFRGTTESHSIYKTTSIFGSNVTVQAVPFSRVLSTYWTEKPTQSSGGGFLGDGEAEFAANTSGVPALFVKPGSSFKQPAFDDSSKDATKWGVPIDHLKP